MLPLTLAPPPPFPAIVAQSSTRTFVAPGVHDVTYHLTTNSGPLVVRCISVDLAKPTVRLGTVLAHDQLTGSGETVSSMARRSGAVAGINADYFDIGQTNQPLNIVVRDGALVRTTSGRAVLSVGTDRTIRFGTYAFSGTVADGDRTWQLEGVDEWPPQGTGAMLMTRAFGTLPRATNIPMVTLAPAQRWTGSPSGEFHVTDAAAPPCPTCAVLAFGARAQSVGDIPAAGDVVRVNSATDPPLDGIATAVGGGPLLVHDGAPYDDRDPPSPAEALQRDPQAGAIRDAAGAFALVAVDGRARGVSVGLTRPELTALFLGLGATDGIAFDSGGSVALVARDGGDRTASLQNVPSDGHERPVADGLFVYSDLAAGSATGLAIRPAAPALLIGATIALGATPIDAGGVPAAAAPAPLQISVDPPSLALARADGTVTARSPGTGIVHVRRGALAGAIPLRVVSSLAALRVDPPAVELERGGSVAFRAAGADASGAPVRVDGLVAWTATGGTIAQDGSFRAAAAGDGAVVARAGGLTARAMALVGRSERAVPAFAGTRWTFSTYPAGGTGSATVVNVAGSPPELDLMFSFAGGFRGAYANAQLALAGKPLAIAVDVRGDGSGAGVRAAFTNADGDRIAVTLARRVDWNGWRTCTAVLPSDAAPPVTLRSLYAVASLSQGAAATSGTLAFRALRVTFAGRGSPEQAQGGARPRVESVAPTARRTRGEEDS